MWVTLTFTTFTKVIWSFWVLYTTLSVMSVIFGYLIMIKGPHQYTQPYSCLHFSFCTPDSNVYLCGGPTLLKECRGNTVVLSFSFLDVSPNININTLIQFSIYLHGVGTDSEILFSSPTHAPSPGWHTTPGYRVNSVTALCEVATQRNLALDTRGLFCHRDGDKASALSNISPIEDHT